LTIIFQMYRRKAAMFMLLLRDSDKARFFTMLPCVILSLTPCPLPLEW